MGWKENEKEQQQDVDNNDQDNNKIKEIIEFKSTYDDTTTIATSDDKKDTTNTSSSSKKQKDNIKKPFLTIDVALCPNNYEKISKEIKHYHHYIRKTILEYALDHQKLKEIFFWFNYDNNNNENDNNEVSERSIFWKNILNEKKTCRSMYNDITISFDNDIPIKSSSKHEKVSMPIVKITFPNAKHNNKSCIDQFLLSLSLQKFI